MSYYYSSNTPSSRRNFWGKLWQKLKNFHRQNHRWLDPFAKKVGWLILAGIGLGVIFLLGAFAWYSRDLPDPDKIMERNIAQSTKIYDRTGETLLYDVHGDQKRTLVKLADIPDIVKWATISAEDKHFYEHGGFNLLAMFKGVIIDPLFGRRARGGSTLTQQFVKNAILTNERSIERKIKEFILSYRIEKIFSKDEILQMYLNEIPYGSVAYGIQSAAQTFLGKNVADLNLAEAAVLAAIPQAPTYYSPFGSHEEELFVRQRYVLDEMVDNGYITKEQAEEARTTEIKFAVKREAIVAPHFVMYVKELLSEKLGDDLVERGGLKVITTLDLDKQKIAEEAVVKGVEERGEKYGFHNAALVALDAPTGQILAMVGSKDYFDTEHDGNVNVTLRLRQPGSSIKPMVYTAAFKAGYTPNTVVYDTITTFKTDTKDYRPLNYDLKEHGPVTLRKALAGSLNIPAVKVTYLVGINNVLNFLETMGYTSFEERSRFGLSIVLGGGEVRLLEHAAAYGAFATEGTYHAPAAILRVEDSRGNVLWEYKDNQREVLDRNIARMTTDVLSDNNARAFVFGTQHNLILKDRSVAAKTGTTNDYHDAWAMGYTPGLVAGVWVGNNNNAEMKRGADGSVIAAPIWNEFMSRALAGTEKQSFNKPEIPSTGKPILDGDVAPEFTLKIDKYTGKLATALTPASFIEERQYRYAHCILHYVNKNDPRGAAPNDPHAADPAYKYWEAGVQDWLSREGTKAASDSVVVYTAPPTEYDDVHVEENKPTIFLKAPNNNETVRSRNLYAQVSASAPRGISRVEYYLDDKLVGARASYPYDLNFEISAYFGRGYHTLKAVAYDDVDNSNEAAVELNILADFSAPQINLTSPNNNPTVFDYDFPLAVSAQLTDILASPKVDFYSRKKDGGQAAPFASVILPTENYLTVSWPKVYEKGEYELYAEISGAAGNVYRSNVVSVYVN